jgi:hypothetical protein
VADTLLTHGCSRLVYGVALARNFREYLLGLDNEPDYPLSTRDATKATDRISLWWAQRWLKRRILREDILDEAARHKLSYPVRHGARVPVSAAGDMPDQLSLFDDVTAADAFRS